MKLYGYFRSSAAYRVRIALNLKGVDCEAVPVDLRAPASAQHTPEFLALNPQGLVPVLVDGATVLTQSLAIIEYLEETHPQPPLLPRAPADAGAGARARTRHRLRHPSAQQHARAQLSAHLARGGRSRGECLVRALDGARLARARERGGAARAAMAATCSVAR